MKRSEMIQAIKGDLARMDLDFLHGRNLDKTTYHERVESLVQYVLFFAERYGMYPPQATTTENSEHFSIYIDNIDIPHRFVLGWDDE